MIRRFEPVEALQVVGKAAKGDTRATNLRLVLQHLFAGEALSRADLARRTALTPATVSNLVGELGREGLIREVGTRRETSQVGKPPTMFEIDPDGRSIVALDLSDPDMLRSAVIDLAGAIRTRLETTKAGTDGDENLAHVLDLAGRTIEVAPIPVLGIGVGTPGVVDPSGTVIEASNLGWHDVELGRELEAASEVPAYLGNDANVAAIAEFTRGHPSANGLAVVTIGSGVGTGLILNGRPFPGAHSAAGELGHFVVDPSGPPCPCGSRGCLETFASVPAIEAAARADGDMVAASLQAAEQLGVALAAIVAVLDLDRILVTGPAGIVGKEFCKAADASMRARCLQAAAGEVTVECTSRGSDIVLHGAARLVLSQELGIA